MLQSFVQHFIKADRVNEKTSVDSVNHVHINILAVQIKPVDIVASEGRLLAWLEHDSWNIQMLRVGQRFINPRLKHASVQDVTSVSHSHNLLHSSLKRMSIGCLILSKTGLAVYDV